MNRPWRTGLAFGACLAIVLAAMGWVSWQVVRLDRSETKARQQAALEESVRLALWRMESALAPLIAQESGRPSFVYTAFYAPEQAYSQKAASSRSNNTLIPSPLLTFSDPNVVLHFQIGEDGNMSSPQVPTGAMRTLAESRYTDATRLATGAQRLAELAGAVSRDSLLARLSAPAPQPPPEPAVESQGEKMALRSGKGRSEKLLNEVEYQARQSQQVNVMAQNAGQNAFAFPNVREEITRPIWIGDRLILARRVSVYGRVFVQGCWLDWPAIRASLLSRIQDLTPAAMLQPIAPSSPVDASRMLAGLPARFIPGAVATEAPSRLSPLRISLLIAWACVVLAALAVAVLLRGAVMLSERRGAFVSAVTHELRTPLTTLRMYAEMLVEGMLPDEQKRRQYLVTIRAEADRLAHLVENVLAYSRLERGRARGHMQTVQVSDLLAQIQPRLIQRAEQAGMQVLIDLGTATQAGSVRADVSAVEQILFNLVDNACKYVAPVHNRCGHRLETGATGPDSSPAQTIHIQAARIDRWVAIRVRDHGPGIAVPDRKRLFRPFSKSARDAANSAPGVGLGLALSRRLARDMGGDLRLDEAVTDGACFLLTLPRT